RHETGQPVLVGTTDIAKRERLARMLEKSGVPHAVLNAKFHEKEASIVENAGQYGAVTIATNMAGRGTDIKLGEGVSDVGGLHIIGTERHESRRIDNQLRGRSGRQGDPGSTRFYISLEDELMRIFGPQMERVGKLMEEDVPLESRVVTRAIQSAQSKVEGFNFDARRHVVEYDDVMNKQREVIYSERRRILEGVDTRANILDYIRDLVADTVPNFCEARHRELWDLEGLFEHLGALVPLPRLEQVKPEDLGNSTETVVEALHDLVVQAYEALETQVGEETMRQVERFIMLSTIDQRWVAYLTLMEQLKEGIGLQGYAQKDPLVEYKNEAFIEFEKLKSEIQFEIASRIFRVQFVRDPPRVASASESAGVAQPIASGPDPDASLGAAAALAPGQVEREPGVSLGAPSQVPPSPRPVAQPRGIPAGGYAGLQAQAVGPGRATSGAPGRAKVGRNDLCPCGSGRKYKRCHGR
ncbi:MAG: preprotein translocase subunit SecA, partial [Candidatus Dormibacteria bacterium]